MLPPAPRTPVILALLLAAPAFAERPPGLQPRVVEELAVRSSPADPLRHAAVSPSLARQSASGITWVRVHLPGQSPCPPEAASGNGQTEEHVWCFEGAGGDSSWPAGTGTWTHHPVSGAPDWDGWQMVFDPVYAGEGNSCTFTDDWLWSAKEGPIPAEGDGFHFQLVSPSIPVEGWTGGVVQYDMFPNENGHEDYPNTVVRAHDTVSGWSVWNDFDGFLTGGGGYWIGDKTEDFSDLLAPGVDSVQVAWELIDMSVPGSFEWSRHAGVKFFVDNVSFGSYDATVTRFASTGSFFIDTFSRSDPAHSASLENDELGDWIGTGGARPFTAEDSLNVGVTDPDGITASNVLLTWSTDGGSAWHSKTMDFALPDPLSSTDEGVYRAIIGADDGGVEDMTAPGDGLIWEAGDVVDYYVTVTDDTSHVATFPEGAPAETFRFRVLPSGNTSPAQNHETYLLVDDAPLDVLDVESSGPFAPGGGIGGGTYEDPGYASSAELVRSALDSMGLLYDVYTVVAGSTGPEPRGYADPAKGLGGLMNELGDPTYDCVIWVTGRSFPLFLSPGLFSDESRANLAAMLDGAGRLLVAGDGIASDLGSGGNAFDPTFLSTYLGTILPDEADGSTENRILNTSGSAAGTLTGIELGLYGDCPTFRSFDRLTMAGPIAGSSASALMEYAAGGAGDNGRASAILNERTASGGRAVLTGFGPGALLSTDSRACLLGSILSTAFGLTLPGPVSCVNNGVDAPLTTASSAFRLSVPEPNPFRDHAAIRFVLPERRSVSLGVYDVFGRRVRSIVSGPVAAGVHVQRWDGRDQAGDRVASGIYFVRLEAGDLRTTRKVVHVR